MGGNFHARMHNSNGKHLLANYLLVAFLGKCLPLSKIYSGIYHCKSSEKFFSVDVTTHRKGQPHTDPTLNKYTSYVIMMGYCTKRTADAVEWLISDSSHTPKLLIADAEAWLSKGAIESKLQAMTTAMEAYYIDVTPVLGLVLGDLLLHALYKTSFGHQHGSESFYLFVWTPSMYIPCLLSSTQVLQVFFTWGRSVWRCSRVKEFCQTP